jgi:hypothetical protein
MSPEQPHTTNYERVTVEPGQPPPPVSSEKPHRQRTHGCEFDPGCSRAKDF